MKKCTRCKQEKPSNLEFFPPHNKTSTGLDSWCRECRREYKRHTYIKKYTKDSDILDSDIDDLVKLTVKKV